VIMVNSTDPADVYEYLCIDSFLSTFLHTQTLKTAFELGLIDSLLDKDEAGFRDLESNLSIDDTGLLLLVDLLKQNKVVKQYKQNISLTNEFLTALKYRDIIETKIEFSNYVTPDLLDNFRLYFEDINAFMSQSQIFELFDYQHCYDLTEENISATRKWMRYTTSYTRYEAKVCSLVS